jgi:hypothetical protein
MSAVRRLLVTRVLAVRPSISLFLVAAGLLVVVVFVLAVVDALVGLGPWFFAILDAVSRFQTLIAGAMALAAAAIAYRSVMLRSRGEFVKAPGGDFYD